MLFKKFLWDDSQILTPLLWNAIILSSISADIAWLAKYTLFLGYEAGYLVYWLYS